MPVRGFAFALALVLWFLSFGPVSGGSGFPGLAGSGGSVEETKTVCRGPFGAPVGLVVCGEATVNLTLACSLFDASSAECVGRFVWWVQGRSPLLLDGDVEWSASALLEWCPPGGSCRGYGVGFRIDHCSWGSLEREGCGSGEHSYTLSTGRVRLAAGECLEGTLSGFSRAYATRKDDTPGLQVKAEALARPTIEQSACA